MNTNQSYMVSLPTMTLTQEPVLILDEDATRNYLMLQNRGTSSILIKLGAPFEGDEGLEIEAKGYYEPFVTPRTPVWAKAIEGEQRLDGIVGTNKDFLGA